MTGRTHVICGDARCLPLPDASVDLIVTSPPYFGLRSYTDGGEHYGGQIGSEATPQEWLAALVECTAEWMRVLKPSGSLFVNLGDKYAGGTGPSRHGQGATSLGYGVGQFGPKTLRIGVGDKRIPRQMDAPPKSLMGLPWRYAIAATDQLGLILRRDIIWSKPNGLPESVTDRCRSSHEYVFHLVRQPRYYAAVDEIREPHSVNTHGRRKDGQLSPKQAALVGSGDRNGIYVSEDTNPLGKLPGSVWTIPSQPLAVPARLGIDHFAAFPFALVRPMILAWSPRAVCADCGFLLGSSYDSGMLGVRNRVHPSRQAGQRRSFLQQGVQQQEHRTEPGINHLPATDNARLCRGVEAGSPDGAEERLPHGAPAGDGRALGTAAGPGRGGPPPERDQDGQPDREPGTAGQGRARQAAQARATAVRLPSLRRSHPHHRDPEHTCPHCGSDQLRPSVTVDPFGGTGTTALAAAMHGRTGITVDMSADYSRLAAWRTTDPAQRAAAMGVPKPPPIPDGMEALF